MVTAATILKDPFSFEEKLWPTQTTETIKKQRLYFANKCPSSQSCGFSSSHVWMWELDYKESWVPKNWCFWTLVLEKTLESPLDCKEIQPVHSKDQSWVFFGRTDAEAETPILWTRKPGVLQSMGSQRVRHDWVTELKPSIIKAEECVGKRESLYILGKNVNWCNHYGKLYGRSLKKLKK